MEINVWIPLLIQLACSFVVLPLVMLVPETRVLDSKGDHQFQDGIPEPPSSEDSDSVDSSNLKLQKIFVFSIFHHCLKTAQFVIHDRSVMFLVITFLVNSFGRQSQSLILQYVSKRYSWALSKVGVSEWKTARASCLFDLDKLFVVSQSCCSTRSLCRGSSWARCLIDKETAHGP